MDVRSRVSQAQAVTAGAAAWLALNAFVYIAAPFFGLSIDRVAPFFGSLLLPGSSTAAQAWAGRAVLLGAALGWSLLYPAAADQLPGPGWLRGVLYGTGIWLASGLLLPLIGAIHPSPGGFSAAAGAGAGPFPGLLGLGFGGVPALALSVLAHQVFGATLGALTDIQARRG